MLVLNKGNNKFTEFIIINRKGKYKDVRRSFSDIFVRFSDSSGFIHFIALIFLPSGPHFFRISLIHTFKCYLGSLYEKSCYCFLIDTAYKDKAYEKSFFRQKWKCLYLKYEQTDSSIFFFLFCSGKNDL